MSVLITGGGSGIGAGCARWYASRGAKVTICGRRADSLHAVAHALGPSCRVVVADVTVAADRTRVVDAAVAHGGGLDALISSAGIMLRGAIADLDEQSLLAIFHTNVVRQNSDLRACA